VLALARLPTRVVTCRMEISRVQIIIFSFLRGTCAPSQAVLSAINEINNEKHLFKRLQFAMQVICRKKHAGNASLSNRFSPICRLFGRVLVLVLVLLVLLLLRQYAECVCGHSSQRRQNSVIRFYEAVVYCKPRRRRRMILWVGAADSIGRSGSRRR
jgi:hypothetical protein